MQTGMTRWTPNDFFRQPIDRFFNQALGDLFDAGRASEEVSNRTWMPPVDVRETDEALTLFVELPGIKSEDVDITVENRTLTIRGERKFEKDVERENFHRIERAYGAFARTFTLPTNVRTEDVEANFADGVLTLALPKAEEAKPRKIKIA